MRILGLDMSLAETGWACTDCGAGVVKTKSSEDRIGRYLGIVEGVCNHAPLLHDDNDFDLVVIEGYSLGASRASHSHAMGELGGILRLHLRLQEIPVVEIAPAKLKKFATGKGNANKQRMLSTAVRLGYPGENDNEADAWFLMRMGEAAYGDREQLFDYQRESLVGVTWPRLTERTSR